VLLALVLGAAGPSPLVVAVPPVPVHDALIRLLLEPYADATQTTLAAPAWKDGDLDSLKTLSADLALVDGEQLAIGCRSGQFRKLDWGHLNRDRYVVAGDCGAGAYLAATALAWDRAKFSTAPVWADFWDVARHPGRRGLQRTARGTLEIALLADGVAVGDVYRTLRGADGLDRAFRKLDQLKPYIQWWDAPAQPGQWLAAGKVLLTTAPAETVPEAGAAGHKRLAVQWTASLSSAMSFALPQNAPDPAAAAIAMAIAGDPARQAILASATGLGPAVKDAADLLPAAVRDENPGAPKNLAGVMMDDGFWADNRAKLEQRFAAWLAK
jgi:putative spermidine/putrescine transport system substrate-binding protein